MEHLPLYIPIVFVLTTLLAVGLLYKAVNQSKPVIIIVSVWLVIQMVVSLTGFYTVTNVMPPRFGLLLLPPVVLIVILFFTIKGKQFIDGFDIRTLTLLHVVRIPVELTLYWLFLHKAVPQLMTFEGRNFDILCGISAPIIYYFGYIKNLLNKNILIGWNLICLILLANIVVTAVLSAPFPFQKLAFNQPNIALFYFPFVWLPAFIVPAALLAHLVSLRRLTTGVGLTRRTLRCASLSSASGKEGIEPKIESKIFFPKITSFRRRRREVGGEAMPGESIVR